MSIDVQDADCARCGHPADQHSHFSSSTHCARRECPCGRYQPEPLLTRLRNWFRSRR